MHRSKKPLSRSITIGCVLFTALLSLALGIITHFAYRRVLYQRYESYITDILNYVERRIDDDDLVHCINTLERSKKFDELELFVDGIKEDFQIHYLYIIKPLSITPAPRVMSVISAENHYDRYVDTEGNLYLGWVSDDEYDVETLKQLFRILDTDGTVFFEEKTEWSTDYTGARALIDSQKRPYAILAVDVDIGDIKHLIQVRTTITSAAIILLGALFTALFLLWAKQSITKPILSLEKSVVSFAEKSHGQRSLDALSFTAPEINTQNEVKILSDAVTQMTEDMRDYVEGIITAERKAADMQRQATQMSELANKDALTGIRNKTAYDKEIKNLEYALSTGSLAEFGIAMIDLNFLKKINDTYGHEQGNCTIKKLCSIVCTTFEHSPVFRIGGDEFVVILKGHDYQNFDSLLASFNHTLADLAENNTLEPWEKVSAAIGVAFFDKSIDANVVNVFSRADQKMYECKKQMKATREN
ncbi:MAG: GGDEF domain-containing protein [Treponema sp.]|nr:GGDEF domain-containing protein [Treponema sp.]